MSIVQLLARQNLILRKNNLQLQLLQNSAAKRNMLNNLSFGGGLNLENISARECALDLDSISASTELMAINAELGALNSFSNKFDYFA